MLLDSLVRDLRYAIRRILLTPGFSAIAVLSLALGIGANTAMFTIVNAVLLADPPFRDADRLVELYTSDASGTPYGTWSTPDYADMAAGATAVFDGVSLSRTFVASTGPRERPEVVLGEAVSVNLFDLHGIPAALGRTFNAEDAGGSGASPVALLNYSTWQQDYGSDPDIIGRSLRLNQLEYTIVGVLPEWFTGTFPAFRSAAWIPINMIQQIQGSVDDPNSRRGTRSAFVRARLAEGVSVEQANAWLESFGRGVTETHPDTNANRSYMAVPLSEILVHPVVDGALLPVAGLLMAMVGLVLLIACANLAGFLLARAEQRRKEVAVRLSIGARRGELVRQLLVESTLLGVLGGAGGLLLAHWAVDALVGFQPPIPVPINLDFPIDRWVLLFTVGVSVLAGTLFGLAPALQATKADLALVLRKESGGVSPRGRLRNALVLAQVSLSLVLLVGSGLFLRSMINAQDADPGFYTGEGAIIWPQLNLTGMSEQEGRVFWRALEDRLNETPGIAGVALTDNLPLGFGVQTHGIEIPGAPSERSDGLHDIDFAYASTGFFEVMEVPLLRGRGFSQDDVEGGEPVAVVSEAFARQFFGGEAVGETFLDRSESVRIVGVVADSKVRTIGESPRPKLYFPTSQQHLDALQVIARGSGSSAEILRRLVGVALDLEPNLVVLDQRTMEEHLSVHLFPPRMAAMLLSIFGGLALLLAAVGIWGVVSYTVARRTHEVGIRVALGASREHILALVVGGGLRVVGAGIGIGLLLAAGAGGLVRRFLYDVGAFDPWAFLGVPALLFAVSVIAAWIPARRAASVDPVVALQAE